MASAPFGKLVQHIHKLAAGRCAHERSDRQLLEAFFLNHDEHAFAAMVARHGPMVMRVCQRSLNHEQDAEDAFQAVFLVLAQNAGSIYKRVALAEWLHGVAYRTAMKAKRTAARRRNHEADLRLRAPTAVAAPSWDDVQSVLDAEIQQLPESLRATFVLCVLEGKSGAEVAVQLGVKTGTVSSRLTRARQRLQQRLTRRGISLAALLAALAVSEAVGKAVVPAALADAAVQSGLSMATCGMVAGAIPRHIAALALGVSRAMLLTKAKVIFFILTATSLVVGSAGLLARQTFAVKSQETVAPANPKQSTTNQIAQKKNDTNDRETTTLRGQVFGPDGRPFAKAKLYLMGSDDKDTAGKTVRATTDENGRFQVGVSKEKLSRDRMQLVALTDGCGPAWVNLARDSGELQLRLPADLPIRGKVVDLEGKPVAGVAIRVVELSSPQSGVLDEFLSQWAKDTEKSPTGPIFGLLTEKYLHSPETLLHRSPALTGPDGTFVLTGLGRDRGLLLGVRGQGIADQYVRVITRPDFSSPPATKGQVDFSGPRPIVAVAPSKPIIGTLRDARTKTPVAGIRVLAYTPDRPLHWSGKPIETVTDAQGHYRLDGLAKSARQIVTFNPIAGSPYLHRFDDISDSPGFTPAMHDSELNRGTVVSGRVTDRSTGRPVPAYVTYAPLLNNRDFTSTPGYAKPSTPFQIGTTECQMTTDADGRYRLTAMPGPGALFVRAVDDFNGYNQPNVARKDQDPAVYDRAAERFKTRGGGGIHPLADLNAYRLIKPTADASELTVDFVLDPGVRRQGRLLDPEGRPLSGVEAFNLNPNHPLAPEYGSIVLKKAEFTAEALNHAKGRRLLFWHHERKLAGTVVLRGDEPEPVLVTLQPLATITGRVTNLKGEPLAAYPVIAHAHPGVFWPKQEMRPKNPPVLTDKDGRFRLPELPAGVPLGFQALAQKTPFAFVHSENIVLKPGQTKDLGDLRGDPGDQ